MQNQYVSFPGATAIVADLAALTASDLPSLPNGYAVFVVAENEVYRLDTANPLTTSSPLIVARGATSGAGKWYRRSRAYVVGNFTLWAAPLGGHLGTGDSKIGGFTPGQITASNAVAPDIILDLVADFPIATTDITGIITDLLGNLWVTGFTNGALTAGAIKKYKLSDCLASGSPSASVSVNVVTGAVNTIVSCFDKQNNLWALFGKGGTFGFASFQKFNQHTYAVTGTPTPDVAISVFNPGSFAPATAAAESMAFDAEGNLWVAIGASNGALQGGIIMLAASQLNVTNASVLPSVFWSGSNFTGGGSANLAIVGLCFGPTGLLWCTSYSGNKIFAYDPRSPQSGNPAPIITLTSAAFNGPLSLCFDNSGNLWCCNDNDSHIYRIPAASLTASGAVVPDVILSQTTILAFPVQITFPNNPDVSGLLPSGVPFTP
jgi:hypothetical protein